MISSFNPRRVLIDGVQVYEVLEFTDQHDGGNGVLTVTIRLNVKKVEIDTDAIRVTTFHP